MQWKRIAVRTIGVLGAVLVIVGVAGYFYLRSSGFERFAIRKIVEQADQATGGRTQIGSLDFSLGKLTARLHNVVIRGTEPPGAPPLLQLDQLTVSLKI